MMQSLSHKPDLYTALPDRALSDYFRNAGELLADESALLAEAIISLKASNGYFTNKDIILWLINTLETTSDIVTSDIIRKTLEIVVGYTSDDI